MMLKVKAPVMKIILILLLGFVSMSLVILANSIFARNKIIKKQQEIIRAYAQQKGSRDKEALALKNKAADLQAALAALKGERIGKQQKLNALEGKVSRFQQETSNFQQDSSRLQQEVARLQQEASGLQQENQTLRQKKDEAEKKFALFQKTFLEAKLQAPPAKAKKEQKPKEQKPKELKNKELAPSQKEITDLKDKLAKLKAQNEQLQSRLSRTITLSTQQNQDLIRENSRLKEAYKNANKISADNLARLKALNAQLEGRAKLFFSQAQGKEQLQGQVEQLNKVAEALSKERLVLNSQIERLKKEIEASTAEKTGFYQELGAAYMQAGLYDGAVDFYNKILQIDPQNAEAHYRLGFLYKRSEDDARKAAYHFRKYLALQPNAKNRKEVEYLMQMLLSQ